MAPRISASKHQFAARRFEQVVSQKRTQGALSLPKTARADVDDDAFGGGAIVNGEAGADVGVAKGALNEEGGGGLFGAAFDVDAFPGGVGILFDFGGEATGFERASDAGGGPVGGFGAGDFDIDAHITIQPGHAPGIVRTGRCFRGGAALGF